MQPDNQQPEGPSQEAVARFWTLNLVRLVGLFIVLAGIAALGDRIDAPRWVAGLLLAVGVGIFFGLPLAIARRWKAKK